MPVDYTIPAKIGAIRTGIIDPMTLANLREQVQARRAAAAQQQAAIEQQNTFKSLLSQAFTRDQSGALQMTPAADELVRIGGSEGVKALSSMRDMLEPAQQKDRGYNMMATEQGYYLGRINPETQQFEGIPATVGGQPLKPVSLVAPERQEESRIRAEERAALRVKEEDARKKASQFNEANRVYDEMDALLDQYKQKLKQYGTGVLPQAELDSAYADLLVNYNAKVAGLGALAGPDIGMLEKVLTPPRSAKGAYYGDKALMSQIDMAKSRVGRGRTALKRDLLGGAKPGEVSMPVPINAAAPSQPGKRPPLSSLLKVQ